jgi:hypothetical protein
MTKFNDTAQFLDMVSEIIKFVFTPLSLLMLLQTSIPCTFKIIAAIFGTNLMQSILENEKLFTIKKSKYTDNNDTNPFLNPTNALKKDTISKVVDHELSLSMYRYDQIPNMPSSESQAQQNKEYYNSILSGNYAEYYSSGKQ